MTSSTSLKSGSTSLKSATQRYPGIAAFHAELTKMLTLRSWWIGVVVILALGVYYTQQDASLLNELSANMKNGSVIDYSGESITYQRAVMDSILATPYQSAAMFGPLLMALVCGHEYRNQQIMLSAMVVPNRNRLAIAKIGATALLAASLVLLLFIVNNVMLLILLPPEARAIIFSGIVLFMCVKVMLYAATLAVFAGAMTVLLRSPMAALLAVFLTFLLAVSGILKAVSLGLHNALPLIGAQTFLFGYSSTPDDLSYTQSAGILFAWLFASIVIWVLAFNRREL